jgi:hypothetical protein
MVPLIPPAEAPDDIHQDTQLDLAADLAQQIEVNLFGIVFGIAAVGALKECRSCPTRAVCDRVKRTRGANELENLLADTMHVDGERNAAEANKGYPQFLLAHRGYSMVLARVVRGEAAVGWRKPKCLCMPQSTPDELRRLLF